MGLFRNVTSAILGSGELAEFTFWTVTQDDDDTIAQTSYAAWSTYLAGSSTWKGLFTTSTSFREGTVQSIDQATGEVLASYTAGTAYAGSGLGGCLPPQCAEVITLRTARAGRSYTGRMYLPSTSDITLTTTGRLLTSAYSDLADEMGAALQAYVAVDPSNSVQVYSRLHHTIEPVTRIDCGDVFDTQRRRRDKLVEVRHSFTL